MCFSLESWASHQSSVRCFQSFTGGVTLILHNSVYFYNTSDLQILLTARCYLKMLAGWLQQHKNLWQDKSCHFSFNKGEKFRILHLPQLGGGESTLISWLLLKTWIALERGLEDQSPRAWCCGDLLAGKAPLKAVLLGPAKGGGGLGKAGVLLGCCMSFPTGDPFWLLPLGFEPPAEVLFLTGWGHRKSMSLGIDLPHYLPLFWLGGFIAFYEYLWILSCFLAGFHALIEAQQESYIRAHVGATWLDWGLLARDPLLQDPSPLMQWEGQLSFSWWRLPNLQRAFGGFC